MISELTKYATEDVLARNKEDYLDENGQLYCASHGKGGMCGPKDYMIQITKREDKKINATAVVKKACGNFEEEYTYDEEFTIEYIKNDNNWIISEYTQTKGELDYYKNN